MSVGTAITVSALAAGVVGLRQGLLHGLRLKGAGVMLDIAGVIGGIALIALGLSLAQLGFQTAAHPVF